MSDAASRFDPGLPIRMLRLEVERRLRPWREARALAAWQRLAWRDAWRAVARLDTARARRAVRAALHRRPEARRTLDGLVTLAIVRALKADAKRIARLVRFVERSYVPAALDRAAARAARRAGVVRAAGQGTHALLEDVARVRAWRDLLRALGTPTSLPDESVPPRPATIRARPPTADGRGPLVVLRPTGGLGNQLFQVAAALRVVRRIGGRLRFDLSHYEVGSGSREFLLPRLAVDVVPASRRETARAARRRHHEPRGGWDLDLLAMEGGCWMQGWWEHPAYFEGIEDELRRSFVPRDPAVLARARALVEERRVPGVPLVAMHVRRGDLVPGRDPSSRHALLPLSYYRDAAAHLPPGSRYLVFSDTPADLDWCRANLDLGGSASLAFAEGLDPVVDLCAMAACDHLVLAASTFSWWAAWLGASTGKVVVMPDPVTGFGPLRAEDERTLAALPGWRVLPLAPRPLRPRPVGARS